MLAWLPGAALQIRAEASPATDSGQSRLGLRCNLTHPRSAFGFGGGSSGRPIAARCRSISEEMPASVAACAEREGFFRS